MTHKLYPLSSQRVQDKLTSINLPNKTQIKENRTRANSQPQKLTQRIFLGYREQEPNRTLAYSLANALKESGYSIFFGSRQSICMEDGWSERVETEYKECDYLVLLLSQDTLVSELVTEGLRRALAIRQTRPEQKPTIIAIRVNVPLDTPVSHELQRYLNQIEQFEWHSGDNISELIEVILNHLAQAPLTPLPFQLNGRGTKLFYCLESRPLPSTEPALNPQDVSLKSPFYVERHPIEQKCYQELSKPGALIRICAPVQMGKTSLLNHILAFASQQNYYTILLDFQKADQTILSDLNQLLRWCCMNIARQLNLNFDPDEYWDEDIGAKASMTFFLQTHVLAKIEHPIILALEEVSEVFERVSVAQDMLTLVRCWHEKSKTNSLWAKMRFIMVQSIETSIPLTINQSPLNVGLAINLQPLTIEQVQQLALRYGLIINPEQLQDLRSLVGGNPYLLRLSLYHLSRQDITLEELLGMATAETGIYSDHLYRLLWKLYQYSDLALAFKQVLTSNSPVDLERIQGLKLKSLGLVTLNGDKYTPACDLYRRYFSDRLKF